MNEIAFAEDIWPRYMYQYCLDRESYDEAKQAWAHGEFYKWLEGRNAVKQETGKEDISG